MFTIPLSVFSPYLINPIHRILILSISAVPYQYINVVSLHSTSIPPLLPPVPPIPLYFDYLIWKSCQSFSTLYQRMCCSTYGLFFSCHSSWCTMSWGCTPHWLASYLRSCSFLCSSLSGSSFFIWGMWFKFWWKIMRRVYVARNMLDSILNLSATDHSLISLLNQSIYIAFWTTI